MQSLHDTSSLASGARGSRLDLDPYSRAGGTGLPGGSGSARSYAGAGGRAGGTGASSTAYSQKYGSMQSLHDTARASHLDVDPYSHPALPYGRGGSARSASTVPRGRSVTMSAADLNGTRAREPVSASSSATAAHAHAHAQATSPPNADRYLAGTAAHAGYGAEPRSDHARAHASSAHQPHHQPHHNPPRSHPASPPRGQQRRSLPQPPVRRPATGPGGTQDQRLVPAYVSDSTAPTVRTPLPLRLWQAPRSDILVL